MSLFLFFFFFFQAEDGIRDRTVTGVQTCALPIFHGLYDRAQHDDPDRALQLVDADLGPHVQTVALHQRRVQPVLQQIEQLGALELLRVSQLADRGNNVGCVGHRNLSKGALSYGPSATSRPPNVRRGFRSAARAAAPRPPAGGPPSPRPGLRRSGRARGRGRRPSPAPRDRRTAPSGGATAAADRAPGSTPRVRSAAPAARLRRARSPALGSPSRSRRPSLAAAARRAAIRCALERAAALACRRYGDQPIRAPTRPAGPETTRRDSRRA